jgi:hypothetical protein
MNLLDMIDRFLDENQNEEPKKINKVIRLRLKVLHKIKLNKSETNFLIQLNILTND